MVETSWTATIALILAILALIIIIVVAVFAFRDTSTISDLVNFWTVQAGATTSPESFTASPNSIYSVNSAIASGFTVNLVAYPGIATSLSGSRTTLFKIDNISSTQNVIVTPPSGGSFASRASTAPDPALVTAGTTATYMWTMTNQVKRLS